MNESIWEYCTRAERVNVVTRWHQSQMNLAYYNRMTGQDLSLKEEQ